MKCPHCNGSGKLSPQEATVGDMILSMRKSLNLTQQDLASKVGLSRAQIANVESGRSDMPISTLKRYADALGCTMKDLLP